MKTVNAILKAVQHRSRNQSLPSHGNTDVKRILPHQLLRLLIRQKIAVRLMHRNPVPFRQNRQPLIPRNLIFLRHLRADRNHQIHRADFLLYKIHDILGRIFHPKHDNLISHNRYFPFSFKESYITAERPHLHFKYSLYQSIASPIPLSKS